MENNKINIVITEDHPIVIEGLKTMLSKKEEFCIAGSFPTGRQLLEYLEEQEIEVILLDISLPDISGLELCKTIKMNWPNSIILILSNHTERSIIMQSIQNGARGYLLKNASINELTDGIYRAIDGQLVYSKEIHEIISKPSEKELLGNTSITKREKQILLMISEGKTSNQIAQELFLSNLTVDTHRKNMLQKFRVKNTAELIKEATRQHLI
jgi:DNA-binding NarL/FixJ family response regulator